MKNAVIVPLTIIFYIPSAYRSLSDYITRDSLSYCAPSPRILRLSIAKGLSPDYVPPKDVSGSMRKNHFLIDLVTRNVFVTVTRSPFISRCVISYSPLIK